MAFIFLDLVCSVYVLTNTTGVTYPSLVKKVLFVTSSWSIVAVGPFKRFVCLVIVKEAGEVG